MRGRQSPEKVLGREIAQIRESGRGPSPKAISCLLPCRALRPYGRAAPLRRNGLAKRTAIGAMVAATKVERRGQAPATAKISRN